MCGHCLHLEDVRGHFSSSQRLPGGGDGLQKEAENGSLGKERRVCPCAEGRETEAGKAEGTPGNCFYFWLRRYLKVTVNDCPSPSFSVGFVPPSI